MGRCFYLVVSFLLLVFVACAALAQVPTNPPQGDQSASALPSNTSAQALIDQALALWQQTKRLKGPVTTDLDAKALLERVVAEYPGTEQAADALRHLAFGHWWKGLKNEAMAYYNRLFTEYPTSRARFRAYLDRGSLSLPEGKLEQVLEDSKHGLEAAVTPEEKAEALQDLGHAYYWMQKYAEAVQCYERLRSEYPSWKNIAVVTACDAECRAHLRDFAGAVPLFEEAASRETRPAEKGRLLVRGAECCREARLFDKGIALLDAFQAQVPTADLPDLGARAQFTRAFLWADKGDLARATSEFQRLIDSYPNAARERPQALLQKGICLQALGDAEGAISCYQALLAAYPKDWVTTEARRRLSALGVTQ